MSFLSHTYEGKVSEKSIAEFAGYTLPAGSCLDQDKGFQGSFLPEMTIFQPKKKPRGGELTPPEQVTKRQISSMRMRIEHAIDGVKRYRIVKDTIRLLKDGILLANSEAPKFRLTYYPSEGTEAWSNPCGNLGFVGGEIGSPTVSDGIRDAVMETCCGLHNFRLWYRPWNYAH